jgi:hypothetical protein
MRYYTSIQANTIVKALSLERKYRVRDWILAFLLGFIVSHYIGF